MVWDTNWEQMTIAWVNQQLIEADSGHGLDHIRRFVVNVKQIAAFEKANMYIVVPAAWLHDCILIAKDSPLRADASHLAAQLATEFLESINYPSHCIAAIAHCIHAHSFSAGIPCETLEACVVQDADRLEALGAIGLARCLMTGGAIRQRLYDPNDPFPHNRSPDDRKQFVDHFFVKLLTLADTMKTPTGHKLAKQRTDFLNGFLHQLSKEIGAEPNSLHLALKRIHRAPVNDPATFDMP